MMNYGLLANQGRREDNALMGGQVAHISQQDAQILRALGGAGTTNPATGLPEYFNAGLAGQGFGPGGASGHSAAGVGGTAASFGSFGQGTGGTASGVTGVGPGSSGVGSGLAGASLGLGGGEGGTPTTVNWSEMGPTTRMQAALTPGTKSAPIATEASKMFMKAGEAVTGHPLSKVSMLASLVGLGLSTFGQALGNPGGYTSAGSPGGQLIDTRLRDYPQGNFPEEPEPTTAGLPPPPVPVAPPEPFAYAGGLTYTPLPAPTTGLIPTIPTYSLV